jgi:hypothetical protein
MDKVICENIVQTRQCLYLAMTNPISPIKHDLGCLNINSDGEALGHKELYLPTRQLKRCRSPQSKRRGFPKNKSGVNTTRMVSIP